MIEQLIYPQDQLPEHLKWQIISFLRIYYPEGFMGVNRLRDWISTPHNHPVSIMLVEAGVLISHTEVVWKELVHAGEHYKAYGLTGVFTYPPFRGQGYGRQIVEAGTAYIDGSDGDIGIFHCAPHLQSFYEQCGWSAMAEATTLVGDYAAPTVSEEVMMMRFLSEKGRQGQATFAQQQLYFGENTW
ncbi:MAG: GNAT family N-acetyltransferase [Caldilineaceae bacterium]